MIYLRFGTPWGPYSQGTRLSFEQDAQAETTTQEGTKDRSSAKFKLYFIVRTAPICRSPQCTKIHYHAGTPPPSFLPYSPESIVKTKAGKPLSKPEPINIKDTWFHCGRSSNGETENVNTYILNHFGRCLDLYGPSVIYALDFRLRYSSY